MLREHLPQLTHDRAQHYQIFARPQLAPRRGLHSQMFAVRCEFLLHISSRTPRVYRVSNVSSGVARRTFSMGGLFIFVFFCGRFWNYFWVAGSMLSCFLLFLLLCLSASLLFLLLFFSASLLPCPCFPASLLPCFSASVLCLLLFLFCFSAFPASLLFCFCASVPFYLYYSTFSFLQSCVFAALLPAPLLLCFLSVLPLCLFFSFILSCL